MTVAAAPAAARECPHWEGVGSLLGFAIGCGDATFSVDDLEAHFSDYVKTTDWECSAGDVSNMISQAKIEENPHIYDNAVELCATVDTYEWFVDSVNRYMRSAR
jgi:hypothetical protein